MSNHFLTRAQQQRLHELRAEDKSAEEIAAAIGLDLDRVQRYLRRTPPDWMSKRLTWTAEEDAYLLEMTRRRVSAKTIARDLGRTPHSVRSRRDKLRADFPHQPRTRRYFGIDLDLLPRVESEAKDEGVLFSDIVNAALREYLGEAA